MSRPIWKGYIAFGLVNIPVILYSGEKKFDIQFKLVDVRNKAHVKYMRVNEQTGEEVPWGDIAKGYEYDENNFILLKESDFKDIAGEHAKEINIEGFVTKSSLDSMDFDKPYYLVPDKKGEKGYVILREALATSKKIGITKVVIHTREYLAALMPYENALILNLLHYHNEIKKPSEFDLPSDNLKAYKITQKEIDIAQQLIHSMSMKWQPDDYHDEYREALQKWVEDKIHHAKPRKSKAKTATKASNVIDFVDLLKKSLQGKKDKKTKVKRRKQE